MNVVIYGDFNCPYSYLASQRADRLIRGGMARIDWRAVEHDRALAVTGTRAGADSAGWERELAEVAALALPINSYGQAPLTNDSIVKLTKAGLTEDVIIGMVNLQPSQYSLTPDDLIALKKDGVSDKIIAAMIAKGQSSSSAKPVPNAGSTVATPADAIAALDTGVYLFILRRRMNGSRCYLRWSTGKRVDSLKT